MEKKVLLIEYEPRSLERLRGFLETAGYFVTEAHDGEEGLNTFSSGRFDIVVLSGMLPRLPSAEVIREIRRKGGATAPPILLMVSGYKGSNRKADAQRVGAFDLLVKPFAEEDFRGAVASAAESTDLTARTVRIPTLDPSRQDALTSSDIFSDVLREVGGQSGPAAVPSSAAARALETEEAVEKRLRDTLSGILNSRAPRTETGTPPTGTTPPSGTPPPRTGTPSPSGPARFSTDTEIEKMISDTLSGIKQQAKVRPTPSAFPSADRPQPVVPPVRLEIPHVSTSGPDRFGAYEVLERIAAGGMAELYKARRSGVEGFQKIVAIKKILPHLADNEEFITMFADEAKLAAQLNHPNIVHIFDLGKIEGGGYFIAMEYVDGRDLRSLLNAAQETGVPLPSPLAVYVASKVAAALDYAHRRKDSDGRELNIVHRDVSPQNILISYEGDIKLCDFGIAKAASKASTTQSGALKGKVQYMSPEQAWGRPIDRRSDLFSLGSVLFEMLTGQKLFRGDSDLTVLEKVRAAQVGPPSAVNPEVPKNLDAVVLRALAREPDDRYANASDMLRDLEAVLYSYTPAPGSADLAIYLHRLQAEEQAAAEVKAREAANAATQPPERKRKSKGAPVARRTGSAPKWVAPPGPSAMPPVSGVGRKETPTAGVYAAPAGQRVESESKSRLPLYTLIGAACLALVAAGWWTLRKPSPAVPAPVVRATPLPAMLPTTLPVLPTPALTPALDQKAIEEEVQRQLAARKKELQKAMEANLRPAKEAPGKKAEKTDTAAASAATPAEAEPSPVPTAPKPTPVPAATEAPPTVPPRPSPVKSDSDVNRGDLVGPGPGVIEPELVGSPKIVYPPIAREQRVSGKVIVLVLVDENGNVADARLQQGIPTKSGVNEAVLDGVRNARFRPATKYSVPVKMWRTVIVDVKP
jgi:TonB family protein